MAYGIEIQNTSGVVQIDQDNLGFGLVASGESYTDQTPINSVYKRDVVVTNATDPVIAVRGDGPIALLGRAVSGSTVTFTLGGVNGTRFNYWVFDMFEANSSGFGVEVYDASGDRTFASDYAPMRVVDFNNFGSSSLPSGKVHACIQEYPGFYRFVSDFDNVDFDGNYTVREYYQATRVFDSDRSYSSSAILDRTFSSTDSSHTSISAPKILVVDVTDIGTQPPLTSTYQVVPDSETVDEGDTITFDVDTTYVTNGTTLYYTLSGTGVAAGDFTDSSLSGSFTVTGNSGSFSKTLVNDTSTEGTESFVAQIRTGSTGGTIVATSISVAITDTSVSPYSITPDITSVNEGNAVTFTVNTAPLADGTTLYYSTSGTVEAADFTNNSLTGSFTVTSNAATVVRTTDADGTVDGSETFELQLRSGSTSGTILATSSTVTINDTSTGPTVDDINGADAATTTGATVTARTTISYETDKTVDVINLNAADDLNTSTWLDSGTSATNYEIKYSVDSGPTSGGTLGGNMSTSYTALGSVDRAVSLEVTGSTGAVSSATLTVTIREIGTTTPLFTGELTMTASILDLGGPGGGF